MGADKFENENLIKYGLPEDIWFHVDDLSSAHVYLRLNKGQPIEDISPTTLEECCQLVKANSIEGCKLKECYVIYTPWANLHKTSDMEIGAIGYHSRSNVNRVKVVKDKIIVNRLNKTKQERFPDLAVEQEERDAMDRAERKADRKKKIQAEKQREIEDRHAREEEMKLKSYSSIMRSEKMTMNTEFQASEDDSTARAVEEDFM